ncbi:MAG TPA: amino acid adenylation domain-containing protein, partial [Thermoanaerobaculia bacterium]|nr:amino acid adenylation domain-containing protein [Thermoanaerobaculia bacterium]
FHPCYGLAEATLLVSGGGTAGPSVLEVDAAALEAHRVIPGAGRTLVGCGRPPLGEPDLAVRIVDPETGAPTGHVGEIWVAGPSVAAGYHGRPEESARTFQAFLPDGDGPFLRTGDLGFLYNGELFVTGRLKDLLILRGRNHYPQDIELTVERAHPGLRPVAGAAFAVEAGCEERLVVVQEVEHRTRPDVPSVAAAVRRAVSEEHELALWDLVLVAAGTIPKTSSGKIQRAACRAAYLDGSLAVVGSSRLARPDEEPDPSEPPALLALEPAERRKHLEDWLRRELAARLGEEPDAGTPVTALGLDSLAAVELAGRIGAAARVAVSPVDLLRGISLAELAAELAARLGEETVEEDLAADAAAPESFPLSRGQRALWFVERLAPGEAVYNLPIAARVSGPLDTGALRRALAVLLARHPALRTEVRETGGEPVQRVRERVALDVRETLLETGETSLAEEAWRPFDLVAEPPLRLRLFRTDSGEQFLLLVVHHLAADFRSLAVLAHELDELYRQETGGAPAALDPLPLRYADWVRWQERWLEGPRCDRSWSYWSRKLAGELPVFDLPGDRPRPPVQTYRGEARSLRLPLSRGAAGVTLFTSLLAALQVLLHRFSGQEDLIVGAPFAGRTDPWLAGVVGYFVNPLPLRGDLSGGPTAAELLARARATVLEALEHQEYPFPLLAERLQPRRDPSRAPLFQMLLVLQGTASSDPAGIAGLAAGEEGARLRLGDLTLEAVPLPERRIPVDLSLTAAESADGGLAATLEFNVDLYDAATAERLLAGFGTLLEGLAGDPNRQIGDLPLLSPAERFQLLSEWSGAGAEASPDGLLHEPFQQQAELRPDTVALVHGEERVSYSELARRARDLAGRLRRLGVGPEVRVGVLQERRPELAVSVLAVLEAGGAYVALDPAYPAERQGFLLEDSGARVLITRGKVVQLGGLPGESPPLSPRNLAYVIYTSGSTGQPKGVALEHRSARALVEWARSAFPPDHLAGVLASTSVGFDLSVFELFVPLSLGGSVILAADALALADLPAAREVTLVNTVPSAMAELLRLDALPPSLRAVNLAGEPFPPALAEALPRRVGRVLNLYGPSEDTTYSTIFQVERGGGPVPIGRPLPGTQVYVLDARLEPVPPGAGGELCLGGAGLARGYLDRPDLTAERFVPDPFAAEPGGRLYRTGDLARYRSDGRDGELEFLGRIDHQVKVRGFRVELGEIEAALTAHPGVGEAVVAALGEGAGRYLVAYLAGEAPPSAAELRDWLAARLPAFMVPSRFVALERLPRTPNGKVDRKALPAPVASESDAGPRTPMEERVATVWAEVLGHPPAGIHEDFFLAGGHSLAAVRVVARLREVAGAELPLTAVFQAPTVAALAARVETAGRPGEPPLVRRTSGEDLPLSFGQQRLWWLDRLEPGVATYVLAGAVDLPATLDIPALAGALGEVVRRHGVLRTVFPEREDGPVQRVLPPAPPAFPVIDLAGVEDGEARRLAAAWAQRGFDLAQGPLLRAGLLRLGTGYRLLISIHHIAADGWSLGLFARELAALYEGTPLPELPVQYGDFALWQRQWLAGGEMERQLSFWRRRLAGLEPLELPADRPRPPVRGSRGLCWPVFVAPETVDGLRRLALDQGTTPFVTLLAALTALLARHAHQEDLAVGTPVAQRSRPEVANLLGFFVNTVAVRADLSGVPSFAVLLARVRAAVVEALAYQDAPFEVVVEELEPGRDPSRPPLVQTLFALAGEPPRLLGSRVDELDTGTAKVDLALTLAEEEDGSLSGTFEAPADLFERSTVGRLGGHFLNLLAGAVAAPDLEISDLELLSEAERRQILEWGSGGSPAPVAATVVDLFLAQAAETPGAPALAWGEEVWNYGELRDRAGRVARRLAARGIGAGSVVGLRAERSPEMVAALLGIFESGGTFLPLDPAYPPERLAFLIADSGAALVVDGTEEGSEETPSRPAPRDAAYLIYTSGTTGTPKGVLVEHASLLHTLRSILAETGFAPGERMPAIAPFSFDIFLFELLAPLLSGGTVALLPLRPTLDIDLLVEELARSTRLHAVPAVLRQVVDRARPGLSLREVYVGGDVVPADLLADAREAFLGARVRVLYGPTEGTILATRWPAPAGAVRPLLGRPLGGMVVRLLDPAGSPVPAGVRGEIHLGGPGVSRGYLGRPDLTAERYLPAEGGERLYRTGDLARWLPDGGLEFLGRSDHQVKVRGFRVEPGEVETRLALHSGVRRAAVVPHDGVLAAFFVPEGPAPDRAELRAFLQGSLPEHMVPAVFAPLPELPLTAHGKVDRRALAALPLHEEEKAVETPRDPVEELLAGLWADLLNRESVGIRDSFFDLGGHSLLATRAVSRIREALGVEVPLRALFETPTVAGLARVLREARQASAPPLVRRPRTGETLPLSFAQQRLWFLWRLAPESPFYNVQAALRLEGPLDERALARSLGEIVRRHEALRTRFRAESGRPVQVIDPPRRQPLPVVDLQGRPDEAERLALAEARRPFDLAREPLLRTTLLRLGPEERLLLVNMHHVVSDGWSVAVLYRELAALLPAFAAGRPSPLPELPVQYADFALWQREWLQGEVLERELAYWRERLADLPVTELPADRPRPASPVFRGATLHEPLPPGLVADLRGFARRSGSSLFMTLLAGYAALLQRYTGTDEADEVVLGSPVANRDRVELEGLVGFFVNTLVLRLDLSGRPDFRAAAARARETALGAWAHQAIPFERLVEELAPEREASAQPFFQTMFQLVEVPPARLELGDVSLERLEIEQGTTTFDLALDLVEDEGLEGILIKAVHSTDLFDESTVRRLVGHLTALLAAAVADPEMPVAELPILGEAERLQLLDAGDGPAIPKSGERVHEAFAARAAEAPEALAVDSVTYGELARRAWRLAHHLRGLGVGLEVPVGVSLERSPEMIVGLLGVLAAGGVYLPLDPSLPAERLRFLREDAGASVVVTSRLLAELPDGLEENPRIEIPAEALAYVIYTSGSTGVPKGVGVSHRAAAAHARAVASAHGLSPEDTVLQFASTSFDVSLEEILPTLAAGARLVLRPAQLWEPGELLRRLGELDLSVADLPPAYWSLLAREAMRLPVPEHRLRLVVVGGDAMPAEALRQWQRGPLAGVGLLNAYGPTEATITSAVADLTGRGPGESGRVPIGRAFPGRTLYVLDAAGEVVPLGVPGELCIGGDLLARGYLRRPELTAERFIPDPFSLVPGGRLYRTGDRVRLLADGELEFLGRIDQQVKIRGFRIEPGEIEAALATHPAVREAVVVAREASPADNQNDRRLVAYVTLDGDRLELPERLEEEQVAEWQAVYNDDVYEELADPTFNIRGWNSSYTRGPIPEEDMREWLDGTVERILARHPRRVLEIGCGTGLVLFRVAPHCERYLGTDFSRVALGHVHNVLDRQGWYPGVELRQAKADDAGALGGERFAAVVLNSVVQYFPSASYLVQVLEAAVARVEPGGFVF